MAFEELKENTENIQEQAKAYLESTAYYKWGFKVAMKSMIIKFLLILLCFSMVLLFCSVAALAGYMALDSYALGFFYCWGVIL
jgi:hypothetical protein